MANPNVLAASALYGDNNYAALSTTSATQLINNASGSGKVYRINSIIVANVNGSAAADITLNLYSAASLGGTAYAIASTVSVPADSSVILVDKTNAFYLKENQSVGVTAGTANYLTVVASWEDIS